MTHSAYQRGSSFFLILLGIAIFAALSFAVLQGGRVSQSSLTADQARLAAQDIIQYANTIEKAVQTLRLRGCSETEISFAGHPSGVANPSAPTDESCHVFSLSGGKATAKRLDSSYYLSLNGTSGLWKFVTTDDFKEIGTNGCSDTTCGELALMVMDLKSDVCLAIEKILVSATTVPTDANITGTGSFAGTYASTPTPVGDTDTALEGRGSACVYETVGGNFTFYQVLIAR